MNERDANHYDSLDADGCISVYMVTEKMDSQ